MPVLDLTMPPPQALADAAAAIERMRARGPVLVCCAFGYSRSACAVAAWLLATGRASTVDAAFAACARRARKSCSAHRTWPHCAPSTIATTHDPHRFDRRSAGLAPAPDADALDAGATLDLLSTGFTLLGAAGIGFALWHPASLFVCVILACDVLLGLAAKWMAVRVRFDAAVFGALVDAVQTSGFRTDHLDRALRGVGMLPRGKEGRDWDTRCHGALQLMRRLGWLVALQGLLFVVAAGTIALH